MQLQLMVLTLLREMCNTRQGRYALLLDVGELVRFCNDDTFWARALAILRALIDPDNEPPDGIAGPRGVFAAPRNLV